MPGVQGTLLRALLFAAAIAGSWAGEEKGQSEKPCYSGPANIATVDYTLSAGPNSTTFTFLVRITSITLPYPVIFRGRVSLATAACLAENVLHLA